MLYYSLSDSSASVYLLTWIVRLLKASPVPPSSLSPSPFAMEQALHNLQNHHGRVRWLLWLLLEIKTLNFSSNSGSSLGFRMFLTGNYHKDVGPWALLPVLLFTSNFFFFFFFKQYISFFIFIFYFFKFYFIFKLYIIVLVLPNIKMNPPQAHMCSPSWTLLPPPSPHHPSGSSQCTSPKHPVSRIEPGLATRFPHDILHVSLPFSQIFPPSPSPTSWF